jgi:16S rRNA (uracil1498-N3)-methyltransferase
VLLEDVTPGRVSGRVIWSRAVSGEPRLAVHVLQAVPAHAMDATIEALTEVGAASIRPVLTSRTVARPDVSRASRRMERWQRIASEAAQLAGRAGPPEVHAVLSLREALEALPAGSTVLACVAHGDAAPITTVTPRPPNHIGLVIGPEGGFDDFDFTQLDEAGAARVHLGPRTLPSRLAGAIATALLLSRAGDLDHVAEPIPQ